MILIGCFLVCLPFVKADTGTTTQNFNLDLSVGGSLAIQDIYHSNTVITFTVVTGPLNASALLNYDTVAGSMVFTPTEEATILVYGNSTDFAGFFNGADLTGGALALPADVSSSVTWQWTPSTIDEDNAVAYIVVACVVVGVVAFALAFVLLNKREE